MARNTRERQLASDLQRQGIAESDYPQYGTSFWGNSANNYGFGVRNIGQNAQNHPAMNMTPVQNQQSAPNQQNNVWNKLNRWGDNIADTVQAASVGYTTGLTLGNFDEAMGGTLSMLTGNKDNYTKGRDAVRKLQKNLSQRHPYMYGGTEFIGALTTPMNLFKGTSKLNNISNAITNTGIASAGYAEDWKDFRTNLIANGLANGVGLVLDSLPIWRAIGSTGGKLFTGGRKITKQGINYFTDKAKNTFYNDEQNE